MKLQRWAWFGLALASCSGATPAAVDGGSDARGDGASEAAASPCVPDRGQWDREVRAHVAQACGACHGERPSFGAPYGLLDYDALLRPAGAAGRVVDRLAGALVAGTMPPVGAPAPTAAVSEAITRWATCGARGPTETMRLASSRPWLRAPERAPQGLAIWELRSGGWDVGPEVTDRYQCFTFTVPDLGPRFIRRFEMILDRREVLHHAVLLRDPERRAPERPFECVAMPEGAQYLMAWAPGQDAFEFPSGGLRMTPGERYVLQIHYNNGSRVPGVRDDSGVRIYHDAPGGTEYGMIAIGPVGFSIPARSRASAASACAFREPTTLFAGGPHMHVIGSAFEQTILRAGGAMEPLIRIDHWDFDYQFLYDLGGVRVMPGDRIQTRCSWNNTSSRTVTSGTGTQDEMCFNFAYVTPPVPARYCDQPLRPAGEITYAPGRCAPPAAGSSVPLVTGRMTTEPAPAPAGGEIPAGRWELRGIAWHVDTVASPIGTIDVNASVLLARGQLFTEPGRMIVDMANRAEIAFTGGVRFDRDVPVSLAGTYTGSGPVRTLRQSCPGNGETRVFVSAAGDELTLGFDPVNFGGINITSRYAFRRVP